MVLISDITLYFFKSIEFNTIPNIAIPHIIENKGIPFCEMMRCNQRRKLESNQISEVTYLRNLQTIEQIERFPIGTKRIDEITSDELQEFMNYHKYLSNSSINKL